MIAADFVGGAGADADVREDVAVVRTAFVLAGVGVASLAVALAVLPVLVALGVATGPVTWAAMRLERLAVMWAGVQLAATILGATRFMARPWGGVLAASDD